MPTLKERRERGKLAAEATNDLATRATSNSPEVGQAEDSLPDPTLAQAATRTPALLPILAVEHGCLAQVGGNYAALMEIQGQNVKLMSEAEKRARVRQFDQLISGSSSPLAFYASLRPHHLDNELAELEAALKVERSPALYQQYLIQSDHLKALSEEQNLTRRNYYVVVGLSPGDLKAARAEAQAKLGFGQRVKHNFTSAFSSDPSASPTSVANSSKGPVSIPANIASETRSAAGSFGGGLRSRAEGINSDEEIIRLLGGLFESRSLDDPTASALNRIGGVEFEEYPDYLKLGDTFVGSLYITDYPRWLHPGSLFEIVRFRDIQLDLAVHIFPLDNAKTEEQLKNRQSLLIAVRANDANAVGDAQRSDRIEGLHEIRRVLARGDARLFQVGIRVAVRAQTHEQMLADLRRVAQRFAELGFKTATPLRNQRRAFLSCLPFGVDLLAKERLISDRTLHPNLTGENVACLLPNVIINATMPRGIPLGIEKASGGLYTFNRWAKEQVAPHSVICAFTGGGKTNSQAEEAVQETLKDPIMETYMIDPQGQISLRLAELTGGIVVDLGPDGKACFNPFDRYSFSQDGSPETLAKQLEYLVPLIELMMRAEMGATERSAFNRAVKRLYAHFEEGESWVQVIAQNFAIFPQYIPLRPYLLDYQNNQGQSQEGIMTRLGRIWASLATKYQIPRSGKVTGVMVNGQLRRPICHLSGNRWYYRGEGETPEPFVEPEESAALEIKPASVWYPEAKWFGELQTEFEKLVEAEQLFDGLDRLNATAACRDAFVELCRGMPILSDLLPALVAEGLMNLASNLDTFVDPELLGPLFNGYTNVNFAGARFVGFNCLSLDEEVLKTTRIFQVITYLWGIARATRKRRMLIADEFQLMLETFGSVGRFIKLLFMRGRAFGFAITAIVQNISAFLDNPDGRVCIELASRVILMKQQRGAEHRIKAHFGLTDSQVEALLEAVPGECLVYNTKGWIHMRYIIPRQRLKMFETNLPE